MPLFVAQITLETFFHPNRVHALFTKQSLNDGCFYLVESDKADPFNAVYTQAYLPSRSRGEIRVEEDNYPACPNNRTNKVEVPYIFLGGHSRGIYPQQSIDGGLIWQCGGDNWAVFMNLSDSPQKYSSVYRLPAGQVVDMWFWATSLVSSNGGDLPRIQVAGNFVNPTNGFTFTGWLRITCGASFCGNYKWDRSGIDQNFRAEVNLAQGEFRNGTYYKGRIPRSGALFDNTQLRRMYLGKLLYNSSTQHYYWSNASSWNVGASKSASTLTEVQCITPSSNYTITGNANVGTVGTKIKVNVLY